MADMLRLFSFRLPAFSPDLNPIEKLWRNTKKEATHLKYFKCFEDIRSAVTKVFEGYMSDAAKVVRVMAKLREEAEKQIEGIVYQIIDFTSNGVSHDVKSII
jgi:hypothetical protein